MFDVSQVALENYMLRHTYTILYAKIYMCMATWFDTMRNPLPSNLIL